MRTASEIELERASAVENASMIRTGVVTAAEVLEKSLARVDAVDDELHAFH